MKKIAFVTLALVFITPLALNAFAQTEMQPMTTHILYTQTFQVSVPNTNSSLFLKDINLEQRSSTDIPVNKMSNGVLNIATSWVDIPKEVVSTTEESNLAVGLLIGTPLGVILGVQQLASGAVDVATYPVTPQGDPLAMSQYTIEHVENGAKIKLLEW